MPGVAVVVAARVEQVSLAVVVVEGLVARLIQVQFPELLIPVAVAVVARLFL
jgi:hypothetical protein